MPRMRRDANATQKRSTANLWRRMAEIALNGRPWIEAGEYLGEYFSDSLVAILQNENCELAVSRSPIKDYIQGERGIVVRFVSYRGNNSSQYLAVYHRPAEQLDFPSRLGVLSCEHRNRGEDSDLSMLVLIPQGIEKVKMSARRIPSLVRLYRVESSDDVERQGIDTSCKEEVIAREDDGELEGIASGDDRNERPEEIIKGGSHVVNRIADNDAKMGRQRLVDVDALQPEDVILPIIVFGVTRAGLLICPILDPLFELRDVEPCTLEPESKSAGWIYFTQGVPSLYDRGQQATYPENPKGPRNPCTQAQGFYARPEKGSEALNSEESPEEVTPQTGREPTSGDCSATHTRLGSPEDA